MGLTRADILQRFAGYGRHPSKRGVGAEFERHLIAPDGTPLPYDGDAPSVRWLLNQLGTRGWTLIHEAGNPIAASKDGGMVTLEPGGQFELSSAVHETVAAVHEESSQFRALIAKILAPYDVRQVELGHTPYARADEIAWVPKGRYVIMREHLAATGSLAHHMMKCTAAVQATYDYWDEADCARKVRLIASLGPLTTAMFANSPVVGGQATGYASWRGHIWTQTDPARTGFPEALLDFSFERWVDYLLDVPLLFRRTAQDRWLPGGGLSFRTWMALDQGPSWDDWDLHMTSVFPEVRIKHAIEVRGADCVPHPLAMAFVALFKVLLYEAPAMDRALELAGAFSSVGTGAERFAVACRDGLRGSLGDRALSDWAAELVQVALDAAGPEDRAWMAPLVEQVERGESPGHTMLRRLEEAEGAAAKLIAMGAVEPEAEEGARGGRAGQLSVAGELEQVIARCGALRRQLKALRRRTGLPVRRTRRQLRKLERVLRGLVLQLVEQELASGRMGEVMVATSAYVDALDGFGAPDSREELRVVRKRTRAFRKRLEQDVKGDAAFG